VNSMPKRYKSAGIHRKISEERTLNPKTLNPKCAPKNLHIARSLLHSELPEVKQPRRLPQTNSANPRLTEKEDPLSIATLPHSASQGSETEKPINSSPNPRHQTDAPALRSTPTYLLTGRETPHCTRRPLEARDARQALHHHPPHLAPLPTT
jgi:hypothetical protein